MARWNPSLSASSSGIGVRGSASRSAGCRAMLASRACADPGPCCATRDAVRALIFDLDGTLVDTVYAHVLAWQQALAEAGMPIDGWRIHRKIGMSGGLFTRAVARETGVALSMQQAEALQARHGE